MEKDIKKGGGPQQDSEKLQCNSCNGKGKIHPSDTLAHDEESCLWCEDCKTCKGQGVIVLQPAKQEPVPEVKVESKQQQALQQELQKIVGRKDQDNDSVLINEDEEDDDNFQEQNEDDEISQQVTAASESLKQQQQQQPSVQITASQDVNVNEAADKLAELHASDRPQSAFSNSSSASSSAPTSRPETPTQSNQRRKSSLFAAFGRNKSSSASLQTSLKQNLLKQSDKYYLQLVNSPEDKPVFTYSVETFAERLQTLKHVPTGKKVDQLVKDYVIYPPKERQPAAATFYTRMESSLIDEKSDVTEEYLLTVYRFELTSTQLFKYIKSFYNVSAPPTSNPANAKTSISSAGPRSSKPPVPQNLSATDNSPTETPAIARKRREQEEKERKEFAQKMIPIIRNKSVNLLIKWMSMYWKDFDKDLIAMIESWAAKEAENEDNYALAVKIQESLRVKKLSNYISFYRQNSDVSVRKSSEVATNNIEGCLMIIRMKLDENCKDELTLETALIECERSIFSNVKCEDLYCVMNSNMDIPEDSMKLTVAALNQVLDKMKHLRSFIITAILVQTNYKQRQAALKQLFKVLFSVIQKNRLTLVTTILSALLSPMVLQNHIAFAGITSKYFKQLREIVDQMNAEVTDEEGSALELFKYVQHLMRKDTLPTFQNLWKIHELVHTQSSDAVKDSGKQQLQRGNTIYQMILQATEKEKIIQLTDDLCGSLQELIGKDVYIISNMKLLQQLSTYSIASDLYFNNSQYVAQSGAGSSANSSRPQTPTSDAAPRGLEMQKTNTSSISPSK